MKGYTKIIESSTILTFLEHIFGAQIPLALDYIQIMYLYPWQKLPALILFSKENGTGKSTFGKLMKIIFRDNCAIVSSYDFTGDFNNKWATKKLIVCDEAKLDRVAVIEKVKELNRSEKITVHTQGKYPYDMDCYLSFVLLSNFDPFIYTNSESNSFWRVQVPSLAKENPSQLTIMANEIPAFVSFLVNRELSTKNQSVLWFHPSLYTKA